VLESLCERRSVFVCVCVILCLCCATKSPGALKRASVCLCVCTCVFVWDLQASIWSKFPGLSPQPKTGCVEVGVGFSTPPHV